MLLEIISIQEYYRSDSSLIQLFNKCLLSPYYVPATFLGTVDTEMRKRGKNFCVDSSRGNKWIYK